MAYCVFESTNMGTTKYAERIFDAVFTEDVENGTFGYLDGLEDGEAVIYKFKKGFKAGEPVVVVDNPAWNEDTCRITNQRKDKYIVPAGVSFRVRVVKLNDEFSVSAEGFTPETAEQAQAKKFVTIDTTTGKLKVESMKKTDGVMCGEIMRVRNLGGLITTEIRNYGYTRKMYDVKVDFMNVGNYTVGA